MKNRKISHRITAWTMAVLMSLSTFAMGGGTIYAKDESSEETGENIQDVSSSEEEKDQSETESVDSSKEELPEETGKKESEEGKAEEKKPQRAKTAPAAVSSGKPAFNNLAIFNSTEEKKTADLLHHSGDAPALHTGVVYALDISYSIPKDLQKQDIYFNVVFGDGLYVTTLPGATFKEGPLNDETINSTGFTDLIYTPSGNGTAPYGYPGDDKDKSRNGRLTYLSKKEFENIASTQICFVLDEAYLNESKDQILSNALTFYLSTTPDAEAKTDMIDYHSYDINAADVYSYGFYIEHGTEDVQKGEATSKLGVSVIGGKGLSAGQDSCLTDPDSKTTVEIEYPKDIELVSLEDKGLYNSNGKIVSTKENGDTKISVVSWDEPGSYSTAPTLYPHFRVPEDSKREYGTSFTAVIRNYKKTVYKDTPEADRTTLDQQAVFTVNLKKGTGEDLSIYPLKDTFPDWAYHKYDTYNVRLGSMLIRNNHDSDTAPKTLEITADETNTAIIRGITIPYSPKIKYGQISWTSADGRKGTANPSVMKTEGSVAALITNQALGLDINDSIKSLSVNLSTIPGGYDGVELYRDTFAYRDGYHYIFDQYYGWFRMPVGVFGSWKCGTKQNVVSHVRLYTTGEQPTDQNTYQMTGIPDDPVILNGVGTFNKKQVKGGESFEINGKIDDGNWDWNPLQEPVIYVFMPEGFSYSNLTLTNGTLSPREYIGEFSKDGTKIRVWKYIVDIGQETRGQYQPDFGSKSMEIKMEVKTSRSVNPHLIYHINDFLGFTTKDFKKIKAKIKCEHFDCSNWNTEKYTKVFGNAVNSGATMVSLSEGNGIQVKQGNEITAQSELVVPGTDRTYIYDDSSEKTKTETTPVLNTKDAVEIHITVHNDTGKGTKNPVKLFVPMLRKGLYFGEAFMPEGANQLPLSYVSSTFSKNFKVHYLKIKKVNGKSLTFGEKSVPKPGDYTEVTDVTDASDLSDVDMLMFESTHSLGKGEGGEINVRYTLDENIGAEYDDNIDVITPVLNYDIKTNESKDDSGNKSIQAKAPAAVTFKKTGKLIIQKNGSDNTENLGGAVFDIYKGTYSDRTALKKEDLFKSGIVTLPDSSTTVSGLKFNDAYTLVERTAPEGYQTADPIPFSITDKDGICEVTVTDEPVKKPDPDPEPDPKPDPEPDPQPEPEPDPDPIVVPDPDPEPTVTPEPDPKPTNEPDPVPSGKPEEGTGSLSVIKTVIGDENAKNGAFSFTVALSDQSIDGTYGEMTFHHGVSSFTLKHGEGVNAEGLPAGTGYSVSEADYSKEGYVLSKENGNTGNITANETEVAEFINTQCVTVQGTKTWNDNNNQAGARPASIVISLYRSDVKDAVDQKTITAGSDGTWSYRFTGLPKVNPLTGKEYEYHVKETVPDGYSDSYDGYNITNTYNPEKTSVSVRKVWDDMDNLSGKRPASVTVNLLKDGAVVSSAAVSEGNGWTYTWSDLDSEGTYTVQEVLDANTAQVYPNAVVTGDAKSGFTITNTIRHGSLRLTKLIDAGKVVPYKQLNNLNFAVRNTDTGKIGANISYALFEKQNRGTSGHFIIDELPVGNYEIIETNTVIPGFDVRATVTVNGETTAFTNENDHGSFGMNEGMNQNFDISDTYRLPKTFSKGRKEAVNTGDRTNVLFYGLSGATAIAVIALVLCWRRKTGKNQE